MLQTFRESFGRWVAVAILSLIAVTFIFFGVDFSLTGATFAAKVNGEEIPLAEFERELQVQQTQYQQSFRVELTEDLRRELRQGVIERLVSTEALQQRVESAGYRVSDARLIESIRQIQAFQVGGQFSQDVYNAMLANQGFSPAGFEQVQRGQLALMELQTGLVESTFLTPAEFRRYIELNNERRELAYALFQADDFVDQVEVGDAEIAEYYEANSDRYMSRESVNIEYIELSLSDIAAQIEVSDADLRSYYEQERERFQTEEERRVRHILINVESGELQAAQARADEVLSRLNAGEDFASLAQELSDDVGTRAQGGELGWIARGTLPGPFEDALYSMDLDEVRGPVQTDFGLHIMQLEELREGDEQPFEAIRDELRDQYQTELADQSFYDRANELADKAFEAYDELATVAAETNLPLKVATDFSRAGDPALFANSGPVIQAAFDPELLEQGINSPLIELSDNDVLVLRVSEHKLPEPLILEEVQDEIRADLTRFAAEELAADAADTFVAAVEVGMESQENTEAHGGRWFETRMVERSDDQVPTELIAAAFDMAEPMAGQPERQRVPLASGDQAFVVLHSVVAGRPEDVAREERDQRQRDLANQAAGIELSSYVGDVRNQATVRIPQEILNPQL